MRVEQRRVGALEEGGEPRGHLIDVLPDGLAPEHAFALVVGSSGVALRIEREQCAVSVVQGSPDLSAGAVDVLDREWAASLSSLWTRDSRSGQPFMLAWKDPSFQAPFVSLMADAGLIRAMSADGGIVEGKRIVVTERKK